MVLPEVAAWYVRLGPRARAFADRAFDRLSEAGPEHSMPQSRALGGGLYELRFSCEGVSRRVTYAFGPGREVTALTTFRKQRGRERHEVDRARAALGRVRSAARGLDGRRQRDARGGSAAPSDRTAARGRRGSAGGPLELGR